MYQMHQGNVELIDSNCLSMLYCQIYAKCIKGVRVFINQSIESVLAGFIVNKSMLNVSKASECLLIGLIDLPWQCFSVNQIYAKCIKGVRVFINQSIDLP